MPAQRQTKSCHSVPGQRASDREPAIIRGYPRPYHCGVPHSAFRNYVIKSDVETNAAFDRLFRVQKNLWQPPEPPVPQIDKGALLSEDRSMHLGGRRLCAEAFVAGLTMLAPVPVHAGPTPQWPQYGFDARHTMFDPFEHTLNRSNVATLSLQWEFMTGNGSGIAPLSGPALSDGVLYVASQAQTTFTALDAATGTSRWIYTGISTFSDPAVWEGHVYTASLDGNLYAFPTSCVGTCTPTWAVPVGTLGTNSPPTLANGSVYIGGYDGRVYAFDATTGAQLWSARVNPPNVADPLNFAPAVSGGRVFVSGDHGVYAFLGSCSTTCAPLWVATTQFSPAAAPTVDGGSVLVADYQGTVYAIDAVTG